MPIYPYNTKSGDKRYRVTYRDPDHSQRTKRGFRRRKDAQDYLARMTTYISDNDYIDPNAGKTLVCQFADTWLKGKKNVVKPKYYADLECSWRVHVCNAWGNREIASIRHSEIQTWVSELAKKRSATITIRAHGVLKGVLDLAVRDGSIRRNPADGCQLPRKQRKERTHLTPAQVIDLAHAAGTYQALILTLGFCGLRWGEAAALRVKHVDTQNNRLRVRLSWVRSGKKHFEGAPKTWEVRDVPVPDQVMSAIKEQCEGKGLEDLVFTAPSGGHLREQSAKNHGWYARALRDSGVPTLTCHDLRHTAASIAISSGANVKAVQRMLGHKNAAMTLDTYADLFDTDLDDVATSISSKIAAAKTSNSGNVR